MSRAEEKTRLAYWDNIKGVMILLVVFAHFIFHQQSRSAAIDGTVNFIYMFHMPVFVFVSGFLGKSERSHGARAIARLVFLYLVMNSALCFIYGSASMLVPMYSAWYLLALIAWRLTAHHIAKYKSIMLILFSVAVFAGFFRSIDNTLAVGRIIGFYPYYMAGFLLAKEKNEEFLRNRTWKRYAVGAGCLAAFAAAALAAQHFFTYTDNALQMFPYVGKDDSFGRIVLWGCGFLMIYAVRCVMVNRKIPFITMIGRNSLWIFLLHRPVTLALSGWLSKQSVTMTFVLAAVMAIVLCLAFGNNLIAKPLDRFADRGADVFTEPGKTRFDIAKLALAGVAVGFVVLVVKDAYREISWDDMKHILNGESIVEWDDLEGVSEDDVRYTVMSAEQSDAFDRAFRITFAGDLILSEEQVKRAYRGGEYVFADVFEYASPYIRSADYAIGVFEGPLAGESAGYSVDSNGGRSTTRNYPDSFASAVKDAGFDLVTTANNHLLDKGVDGAKRTLDVLDSAGLDHTGSYRDAAEKESERVKIIEAEGIRMAVLSYTYGTNGLAVDKLLDGENSYVTSVACGTEGERFERCLAEVKKDFAKAKQAEPDLIIVLPHMGTQFADTPGKEQERWFRIFGELGADIIFGDHAHVVEPVRFEEVDGRKVFAAYCPGNFANIYREKQGDTSMLIDVFVDRGTKKVIGGAVVPLYTQAAMSGNYRALPVYEIVNNPSLQKVLSTDDYERAAKAHGTVTEVVFGRKMDIAAVAERYYFAENGFLRTKVTGLSADTSMKAGTLWKALEEASSVCFVGDSVTEGSKNGGCPWYEPLEEFLAGKSIRNYSRGGATVKYFLDRIGEIPEADLYVVAVGTNDVRYREEEICAMTADEYVSRMAKLYQQLCAKKTGAKVVLIAPWTSLDGDTQSSLPFAEKRRMNGEYCDALEAYCGRYGVMFVNANPYLESVFATQPESRYMVDFIHPNAGAGVRLYAEAVLRGE